MIRLVSLVVAAILLALPRPVVAAEGSVMGPAHRFSFTGIDGKPMPLALYRGKTLLVVNTASACAFTPQYADLQSLWNEFSAKGLVIIGAPSNDFGGQEPGNESDIQTFCSGEYGVTFPMTEKVHVIGRESHPFYAWATDTLGRGNAPLWNFHKYLVSPDGRLISAFPSMMKPTDPRIIAAIEANLPPTQ